MFRLYTHDIGSPKTAAFYIQSKGNHAGRPLSTPIANCFAVVTDEKQLYELVYSLFVSRKFESLLIGSVVPFIRIGEATKLIETFAPIADKKKLTLLHKVDELVKETEKKYKLTLQMRQLFALEALKV